MTDTEMFPSLETTDRVDHDRKEIITSPRPGAPPVNTVLWTAESWRTWEAACGRVVRLIVEADAAGYRVITL